MYQRMPRTQYACPPEERFEGVPTNGHRRGDANRSSFKLREDFNIDIEHEGHGSWQAPSFARVHGTAYSCCGSACSSGARKRANQKGRTFRDVGQGCRRDKVGMVDGHGFIITERPAACRDHGATCMFVP